ncbi:MAG TPA: hypothetical protein VN684_07075 [Terriglobales bacterium]|nr:hypothetical protein [Terriglobales bacterium]
MIWLFLILAASGLAVFWVGATLFLRMRRHVRQAETRSHSHDSEHERDPHDPK